MRIARRWMAHNLLAHAAVIRDLLALRTAELLRTSVEGLVEVVLLTGTLRVVVIHVG